ncbi:MAG TPA: ASKHA domain-containing protein, partial [Anaerolineales bacterium]|nr:ASKHA domain-containing protein [Anaerolineales bacterium]
MADHKVLFIQGEDGKEVTLAALPSGVLISDALTGAGIEIGQPCGGQGRCGRCVVQIKSGKIRRRSTLRLSPEDVENGYALACQSVIEGDAEVIIPIQEKIERKLTTERSVADVTIPAGYDFLFSQNIRTIPLSLIPPSMDDQTDDWNRLKTAIRTSTGIENITPSLHFLQTMGEKLRVANWEITAILDDSINNNYPGWLIKLLPGKLTSDESIWALAVDIGTTTVTVWLVDIASGVLRDKASEYNGQISRGEDVISRIVYASKENGAEDLQRRVVETINNLIDIVCKRNKITHDQIIKSVIVGNSTMIHLLTGIPSASIRYSPFITAVNELPVLSAREIGLNIYSDAVIDCLPGIASYVGADITAGVLSSGMYETEKLTLFMDVGTNGEIVLGNRDWLVSCACSAGPAFEGAGVGDGMRATHGAIEEVWINGKTYEPTIRVIGGVKPKGICGSGLISLLAELFMAGVIDKAGNVNIHLDSPRVKRGDTGGEYIVVFADETSKGKDITITRVDIDNLLRAKAAIFAGFTVLAEQVGVVLEDAEQILIGGSFGKYINVEKAIQIGLLPDVPWERFQFLGNTAILGAYHALLSTEQRKKV